MKFIFDDDRDIIIKKNIQKEMVIPRVIHLDKISMKKKQSSTFTELNALIQVLLQERMLYGAYIDRAFCLRTRNSMTFKDFL